MTKEPSWPIMFTADMVQAILDGDKTETRRPSNSALAKRKAGDILWVRERALVEAVETFPVLPGEPYARVWGTYAADGAEYGPVRVPERIKLPLQGQHMPNGCFKGAHRIELCITRTWIEPLQMIDERGAIAEGIIELDELRDDAAPGFVHEDNGKVYDSAVAAYAALWDSIYTRPSQRWADNPDVIACRFERTK